MLCRIAPYWSLCLETKGASQDDLIDRITLFGFVFGEHCCRWIPNVLYWSLAHLLPVYGSIPDVFQQLAVVMPFLSIAVMFALQKESVRVRVCICLFDSFGAYHRSSTSRCVAKCTPQHSIDI